jgi:hypothetical protein
MAEDNDPSVRHHLHVVDMADDLSFVDSLDSDSTVSNAPGPGRVMDNLLAVGGRRFDHIFGRLTHRPQASDEHAAGPSSHSHQPSVDVLDHYTFVTDSVDTASDEPGIGNTLGKMISITGERLEHLIAKALRKLGLDLDPSIKRITALLELEMKSVILQRRCGTCMTYWPDTPRSSATSPLHILLDYVGDFRHLGCRRCRAMAVPRLLAKKDFKKLCSSIVGRARCVRSLLVPLWLR